MTLALENKPDRSKRHMSREEGRAMVDELTEEQAQAAPTVAAEELAELEARGRKGIPELPDGWGEVNDPEAAAERTLTVVAYDANGESIDVTKTFYEVKDGEVVDPPRAAGDWSASAPVVKITLPGFDAPIDVDIVKLNFTGNIELDIVGEEHRAIWNALRWKGMTTLIVQAKVRDLALQERTGDRAQATLKILSVTRYTDARNPYDDSTEDDEGTGPECEGCGLRAATTTGEDGERLCDQCAAQPSDSQPATAATGSELDQALAEALAVVGDDDDSPLPFEPDANEPL